MSNVDSALITDEPAKPAKPERQKPGPDAATPEQDAIWRELERCMAVYGAIAALHDGDDVNHEQLRRALGEDVKKLVTVFGGALPTEYVEVGEIDWLVKPFLAKGKLNIVHGDAGVGKTFALLSIGAAISNGADPTELVKHGAYNPGRIKPAKTLYYSVESDAATELKPRWQAMGGDAGKLLFAPFDFPSVNTPRGREQIERAITVNRPALVVFDPITSFTKDVDANNGTEVRAALDPLAEIARKHGTCIVYLVHDKKSQGGKSQHKASGSGQWIAAARAGFRAGRTKDGRTAIVLAKWNNAEICKACGYDIRETSIQKSNGEDMKIGCLDWMGECDIIPGDFEWDERKSSDSGNRSKADRCEQIILDALADGYSKPYPEIKAVVEAAGISEGTLKAARLRLKNVAHRKGVGKSSPWLWWRTDVEPVANGSRE